MEDKEIEEKTPLYKKTGLEKKKSNPLPFNIDKKLSEEINILKKKNTELEKKLENYEENNDLISTKELEALREETNSAKKLVESYVKIEQDLRSKITLKDNEIKVVEEKLIAEQRSHLSSLGSIKRERQITKQQEIVDVCKRLIQISSTISRSQLEFPGYIETLNLVNYLKQEIDRFLLIKEVSEIKVDFRNIDPELIRILRRDARENRIIKKGYLIGNKVLDPAEVEISGQYELFLRLNQIEDKDFALEKKLRSIISTALDKKKELEIRLQEYFLKLERKHLINIDKKFKTCFDFHLLKLIENNPEPSNQEISYKKVINKITEEFRKILEEIPELDLVNTNRVEVKNQEKKVADTFQNWYDMNKEEILETKEKINFFLNVNSALSSFNYFTKNKFPFKIRSNSTDQEQIEACTWLRWADYFSETLIPIFEKEFIKEVGTIWDIHNEVKTIITFRQVPADLFEKIEKSKLEEVTSFIDELLGIPDSLKLKQELRNILLYKGFITKENHLEKIKKLVNLDLDVDLSVRKNKIITFLTTEFK